MESVVAASPRPARRGLRRRISPPVLLAVIFFHLLLGGLATIWVVSKYSAGRKLTFQAGPKSPNPSERALEHRVQLQQKLQTVSAPPPVPQRVLTSGAAKVTLPPLPEVKMPEPAARTTMAAGGSGLAFGSASGSTLGSGSAGGAGAPINFFGIKDISNAVVIMIDVSDSMFTRTGDAVYPSKLVKHGAEQSFQVVRDQAIELVKSLTPQTRFDIIRWSGSAYAWQPQLVPATEANKAAAIAHIQNEIDFKTAKAKGRPGGTRHDYALELAFSLQPQTIYMLTDGNATAAQPGGGLKEIPAQELYRIAETGQKALPQKAHLHTIYYLNAREKPEERAMLMQLAARNGGQFKTVTAKNRGEGGSRKKSHR